MTTLRSFPTALAATVLLSTIGLPMMSAPAAEPQTDTATRVAVAGMAIGGAGLVTSTIGTVGAVASPGCDGCTAANLGGSAIFHVGDIMLMGGGLRAAHNLESRHITVSKVPGRTAWTLWGIAQAVGVLPLLAPQDVMVGQVAGIGSSLLSIASYGCGIRQLTTNARADIRPRSSVDTGDDDRDAALTIDRPKGFIRAAPQISDGRVGVAIGGMF